jgi:hypothetical protein
MYIQKLEEEKKEKKPECFLFVPYIRGVRNQTNLKEKPQTEPTQTEKRIWFECIRIIVLLNCMVRFGFYFNNQTKPQHKINTN